MKNKKIITILVIIIIVALGYAVFNKFYMNKTPAGQLTDSQVKSLVKDVSKLINVPDETPVVAVIAKADQLVAEQKFYTGAKDGDYLIVFPTAQKALIYRKSENRLINVGPIIADPTATTTAQTATPQTTSTSTTAVKEATGTTTTAKKDTTKPKSN
jgi:hypothetical protein